MRDMRDVRERLSVEADSYDRGYKAGFYNGMVVILIVVVLTLIATR